MAAKKKPTRKPSEPTPVGEIIKDKKPLVKSAIPKKPVTSKLKNTSKNKAAKKKLAPKPIITEAMFEKYFFAMSPQVFKKMCEEWNEANLKIAIKPQPDYDHWLNYFKGLPASHIRTLVTTGQDILSAEAYSALRMWHDIIGNPQRINKIHQSGLTGAARGKKYKSIVDLALANDRLGVLKATRDKLAEKLEKGAGNRDTALLVREMTEVMTQISDYEKRLGPKKTTVLGRLLDDMPDVNPKRASKDGMGARRRSFKTRVTIKDLEG